MATLVSRLLVPPALALLMTVAGAALAQTPAAPPPETLPPPADQPSPQQVNLFRPVGPGFDLTPEQQRQIEAFRADPSAGPIQVYRVNLNVPRTADAVNFNLTPGADMMLGTRARTDRSAGDYSWTGGDPSGERSATLVVKDQQVTGTIRDGDRLYRVRPLGSGVTAVIEVDTKKLPPEHPPAFDERKYERTEPPQQLRKMAGQAATAGASGVAAALSTADAPGAGGIGDATGAAPAADGPANACGTIDVLVAYTSTAEQQAGDIDALIQLAVDETNTSYANSGIQPRLRLVHVAPTSYSESGDMELDVARLANPTDGFLDDIPPLRDTHHADIAVLVTGNGNFCGIASDIMATADSAYAVVGQNCATGYYSFGHEIGHLQGARHNTEADPTDRPFAWGHGFFSIANRRRTVMAYDCPVGCTRIDVWASPTVTIGEVAMGDLLLRNDARVLNETACTVSGFRASGGVPVTGGASTGAGTGTPTGPGTGLVPGSGGASTPQKTPALAVWSLLALLAAAPWLARRRERA